MQVTVARNVCGLVTGIGSGACGFNSYCTLDADGRVNCQCPPNYSFFDPDRKYKGCKPDFSAQSCEPGSETPLDFVEVNNINWPLSDADMFNPMGEAQCRDNCLKDCFCAVDVYNSNTCWKKKFPLSNGNLGSYIDRKVLIKSTNTTAQVLFHEDQMMGRDTGKLG